MSFVADTAPDAPSPGVDLLDYGSGDDSLDSACHLSLTPDLISSGKSSSTGTILCSSRPASASTPAGEVRCEGREKGAKPIAAGTRRSVRSCSPRRSPFTLSSSSGIPPQIRLLSRQSDKAPAKEGLPTTLLSAGATEVGEGSNTGRDVEQLDAGSSSMPLQVKEKNLPSVWVQKARLAACNQAARMNAPGGWNMAAGNQDSAGMADCSGQGGWRKVMPRYWWRNKAGMLPAGRIKGDTKAKRQSGFNPFGSDSCFRCLAKDHKIAQCRFPIRCLRCRASGHLARLCPQKASLRFRNLQPQPFHPPHSLARSSSEHPPRSLEATCRSPKRMDGYKAGQAFNRPGEGFCAHTISSTMEAELLRLRRTAVIASVLGPQRNPQLSLVARAIHVRLRFPLRDIHVSRCSQETFLIEFDSQRQHDAALEAEGCSLDGYQLQLQPWEYKAGAHRSIWRYRALLCLEGVPLFARRPSVAERVAGGNCQFDQVDDLSGERERSATIWAFWVWVRDPDVIPKTTQLTLLDPPLEPAQETDLPLPVGAPKEGLRHRVLVHLSILEDYSPQVFHSPSFGQSENLAGPDEDFPTKEHFFWTAGVPDGVERQPRRVPADLHSRLGPRRDDRDDDRHDGAGRGQYREERDRALGRGPPAARGGSSTQGPQGQRRSRSPYGRYRRRTSLDVDVGVDNGLRGRSHTRSPARRFLIHFKNQATPESCKTPLEGWASQHDPDAHHGVVVAPGLPLELEVQMPDPEQGAPDNREDPMLLEATLGRNSTTANQKVADHPVILTTDLQQEGCIHVGAVEVTAVETQLPLVANLARPRPASVLGPRVQSPGSVLEASAVRRSGRLAAKKQSGTEVGGARQASLLLAKRFGNVSGTQRLVDAAQEKIADLFSTPLNLETIQAIKGLAGVDGKAQVDLPAMGLTAEDLSVLAQEITAA